MQIDTSYRGLLRIALYVISIAMALYHMWAIAIGSPEAVLFRGTHLLFEKVLVFLLFRFGSKTEDMELAQGAQVEGEARLSLPSIYDYVLMVVAAAPIVYLFVNYEYIVNRIFY